MAYTTVPTFTDTTATAANFNAYIRDNQLALKDPPSQNYESNEGSNYSTSSTTYSNVDLSDFTLSITTTGGDVMISGVFTTSGRGYIDVSVDGTRIANDTNGGLVQTNGVDVGNFTRVITGLSAGSHTFILMFKSFSGAAYTIYAGAATASYDVHPQFWVRELT